MNQTFDFKRLNVKKILGIITAFIFLSQSSFALNIREGGVSGGSQLIGGVFNSQKNFFETGLRCIEVNEEDDIKIIHNEAASVLTTSSIDYDSLVKEVQYGISVGGSMDFGDNVGLSTKFLNASKETSTSIVFVYRTILKTGQEVLKGPYKLTSDAILAGQEGEEAFQKYCGDQFVFQLHKGAKAFVSVKIDLGSEQKKREISGEIKVEAIDLANISATLKKINEKFGSNGSVTISAYQEGGFAARINSIFGSGNGIANCNASDFVKCEIALRDIVQYFANDFPSQFDHYYRDNSGSGVIILPPSARTLFYTTQSYCKLAKHDRPDFLNCKEPNFQVYLEKMEDLKKLFLDELEKLNDPRIRERMLPEDKQNFLENYQFKMYSNLAALDEAKVECQKDPWSCEGIFSRIEKDLYPLQPGVFDHLVVEDRVKICITTGKTSSLSAIEIRLKKGSQILGGFKLFSAPEIDKQQCFYFNEPIIPQGFNNVEIRVQSTGLENNRCRRRSDKKFWSYYDWELLEMEITHLASGYKVNLAGDHFVNSNGCQAKGDIYSFGKWKTIFHK